MARLQSPKIKQIPSYESFRAKRLIQIFWAVEIAYLLAFLQCVFLGRFEQAVQILVVCVVLLYSLKLTKQGQLGRSSAYMLSVITLMITTFMWLYAGIFDEVVYAYPCILIFAAMFGEKKLFVLLSLFIGCSILLNGLVNQQQWYTNQLNAINLNSASLMCIILGVIAYSIWVLSGDFKRLLISLQDENNQVSQSKKEIEKLLHHDLLTGLPNREMAEMIFKNTLVTSEQKSTALMFIDLDNFKSLNDGLGHQAGDFVLKAFAQRLVSLIPETDTVSRFAGDEFIVMINNVPNHEHVVNIAQDILDSMMTPFTYQSSEFSALCSVGVAVSPSDGNDFDTMVRNADTAMYHSKAIGGNSFHFFNTDMDNQGHEYLNTVNELRKAITSKELVLFYQPKIDIKTKKIIGAEALLRWNHPTQGMISPDSFIPQAEKSGLIVDIGAWVLDQACSVCKAWHNLGYSSFQMAINVSAKQFNRQNITQLTVSTLQKYSLDAQHIELELTESLIFDSSGVLKQTLKELRDIGVRLSIDDFGTGYSNLAYLKEFQIETLKIDQSFVRDIQSNENNKAIVVAIIQIAKSLGLNTVAEGVENQEIANAINALGCDYAQGYLWSKPVSEQAFITLLARS